MKNYLFSALFALLFCLGGSGMAQTVVGLQFERSGTTAADVTIAVVDEAGVPIEGATATMTSSHEFKPTAASVQATVLCPNVNANTSPEISLTFTLSGLPANFSYDVMGMDIHAFNGAGNYQEPGDGVPRLWNILARQGNDAEQLTDFAQFTDIDIAAGVGTSGNVHQVWTLEGEKVAAGTTHVVQLVVEAGSENRGCFFGLSQITLGTTSETVEPEPEPEPEPNPGVEYKVYNLKWKNNTSSYITEEADGSLVIAPYDVTRRQFWEFIPTEKDNCYYLRNTATGRYIGSCNMTPSSASKVTTSETPVEYYVGATSATSGEIKGCFYLSSTDCADYDNEAAGPRALNKDGASSSIITWQAGTSRVGSYWTLYETTDLYEVRPFQPSDQVGQAKYIYTMTSLSGKALAPAADGAYTWLEQNGDEAQTWYFVGNSNATGYQIVNAKTHALLCKEGETNTLWSVFEAKGETPAYYFRPTAQRTTAGTALTVEGDSLVQFAQQRSAFVRANQIYNMPCGKVGARFIKELTVDGDVARPMHYPLTVIKYGKVTQNTVTKPSSWYTIFSADQASVWADFNLHITLSAAPAAGEEVFVYCDWNRDGIFETMQQVETARTMDIVVPLPADAKEGSTRMRIRYTDNGLQGAEDEVTGQIFDFVVNVLKEQAESFVMTAVPNDPLRGTVSVEQMSGYHTDCEVTATALGDASFVCWRDEHQVLSADETFKFVLDRNISLVAVFSPNTWHITDIDTAPVAQQNILLDIQESPVRIEVASDVKVHQLLLFNASGALVASAKGKVLTPGNIVPGSYIVKVVTEGKAQSVKAVLR